MIEFENELFYETKYSGYYVSKSGKILSTMTRKPKLRKLSTDHFGYVRVCLVIHDSRGTKRKSFFLHSLMLETFIGKRPEGFVVDHIDNNKQNNRLDNLRYVSNEYNLRKAHFGVSPKLKMKTTVILNDNIKEYESIRQALKAVGITRGQFERIRGGQRRLLNFVNTNVEYRNQQVILSLTSND